MLDDIEHIIGETQSKMGALPESGAMNDGYREQHNFTRARSIFFTIIDKVKCIVDKADYLVLCSTKVMDEEIMKRFDKTFYVKISKKHWP